MVMSPMLKLPPATSAPAITVIAARPTLRISAWAAFSRFSEPLARELAST
jgi:hypothetical protein